MSVPEKILMCKIKKKEKRKLNVLKRQDEKDALKSEELNKIKIDDPEDIPPKKKTRTENLLVTEEKEKSDGTNSLNDESLPGTSTASEEFNFNDISFARLHKRVCDNTLNAIAEMGLTHLTEIQAKSIPFLLSRADLVGAAKTGSGKTLAFLIPAIQLIYRLKFKPQHGTGCLIISPTRELSIQTFGVLTNLMKYHSLSFGMLMGGADRKIEAQKLEQGVNIVVATPGRLLDHLKNTKRFCYQNLRCLVIDETDRLLDTGFEAEMKEIIDILPKRRQTIVFSATQTKKVQRLMLLAFQKKPVYVGVDDDKENATVEGLQQGYVMCPSENRFPFLFTFLKKNRKKKIMVFFSSCMSVKYHHELLNYMNLPVMSIHGKQMPKTRTNTFFRFCNASAGVLLCTDVAARGLDIPDVDWIMQYDPPDDPKDYIQRVGRTARGRDGSGRAMLILRPEECDFIHYLKHARVPINEFEISWDKTVDIKLLHETLISTNCSLKQAAKKAFKSYVKTYRTYRLKAVFDKETLDLAKVAKSFGFIEPPMIF